MFCPRFAYYNGFSSNSFYDDWVMAAFNTLLLSLPPLSLAFFEKDLTEAAILHVFSFHTTASCCKETAFRLQLYVTNFACTMNIFIIAFASN